MRKVKAFVLALIFVLNFAGCSQPEELPLEENISESVSESSQQSEESSEPAVEEQQKKEPLPEIEGEPISAEEIEFFNELFFPYSTEPETGWYVTNPWSHFFMSYYSDIREMSFPMFIYYFPCEERDVDEREFQALRKVEAWGFDNCETLEEMPVPVHPISKEEVNAVLQEYAGITIDDLDTSAIAYLEEYDCFYNSTSDYGPGMFVCTSGLRSGNTLYLFEETEQGTDLLVLTENEDSYKIISHQHYK